MDVSEILVIGAGSMGHGIAQVAAQSGYRVRMFDVDEKAVSAQYRSLLTVLKAQLSDPKVFKVGERQVAIYVVGKAKVGGVAGLRTTAVET